MSPTALSTTLRAYALSLPSTTEEFPWGDRVIKVQGKIFLFLGHEREDDGSLGISVKLPASAATVLTRPDAKPTGYGLGKAGWVSLRLAPDEPADAALAWVAESYRAVAPKRLAARAPAPPTTG